MLEKGWLRKRPLRESSPNLLPLQHSNSAASFRESTTSASSGTANCCEASSHMPPLQSSSQQKHIREGHRHFETLPERLARSLSWSAMPGVASNQSNGDTSSAMARSVLTEIAFPNTDTNNLKSSPPKPVRHYRRRNLHIIYKAKIEPHLQQLFRLVVKLCITVVETKPTPPQIASLLILLLILYTEYILWHQLEWEIDLEWTTWETNVQNAIRQSIPPRLNGTLPTRFSHLDNLKLFPNLQRSNVSEYIVPMPDYAKMSHSRGKLASNLKRYAINTCLYRQQNQSDVQNAESKYLLPVMGVTVANDTPDNRYLRRILHTVDFNAVFSIVITWYDEHTEAQLLNNKPGLSHQVIEDALAEFIERFDFTEIDWRNGRDVEHTTSSDMQLASYTSLQLMSQTTTSIHQYCRFESTNAKQPPVCQNELVILRFPTNLGCSVGVNNPLFTHPTAPYWLIANYDIAYPPGVLTNMGLSLQNTLRELPYLAVHTFGYIYGRGKLENPWSNFVMTSCAVANVGVWDEDIYPAYYEDDDFRDRIRYILGTWLDGFGSHETGYENTPTKRMDDSQLIRYQTDRSVAVAHGPLSAETYISGTHDTMQKVEDEEHEDDEQKQSFFHKFLRRRDTSRSVSQNPFHYESLRWKTVRELSDTASFFICKHGNLPDPGEFGEDTLRYFGYHERFALPFINKTRVDMLKIVLQTNDTMAVNEVVDLSLWSRWSFNATRRACVHEGANQLLSLPKESQYQEGADKFIRFLSLTRLQKLCSVC
ncbi:hypothetical protein ACHAXN_004448 [Cyclotella atomus]